jgi:hypothetical protein
MRNVRRGGKKGLKSAKDLPDSTSWSTPMRVALELRPDAQRPLWRKEGIETSKMGALLKAGFYSIVCCFITLRRVE